MKVGPGSGVPPLASTLSGAQSLAAEGDGRGDVHQVVTQGLVDEGSDGVTGGLQGKTQPRCVRIHHQQYTLEPTGEMSCLTTQHI